MHAAAGRAGRAAAVVALRTRQCLRSTRVLHLGNSEHMVKPTLWAAPRSGSRAELRGQCVAQALLCTAQRPLARVSLRREYRTDEAAEGGAEERCAVGTAARLGGWVVGCMDGWIGRANGETVARIADKTQSVQRACVQRAWTWTWMGYRWAAGGAPCRPRRRRDSLR